MEKQCNECKNPILEVKDLRVKFSVHKKWLPAVDGVNLCIQPGEIIGVVGESGSGKSVMSQSILRLRDHDTAVQYEGEILFENEDLLKRPLSKMRELRGNDISVIFQDPLNSLSPVHTVEKQISEVVLLHKNVTKAEAKARSIEMLKLTGIPNPEDCMKKYPFELSGGMNQRAGIAISMLMNPPILLADEPTSALDVSVQRQVVREMLKLRELFGTAIIIVTHDIGVVRAMADTVLVLKNGKMVEYGEAKKVLNHPQDPYTKKLLAAVPRLKRKERS